MGANLLGARKTRALARTVGADIVHAAVWSHHDSGRVAFFTTADHRHGHLDRLTGEWDIDDPQPADPGEWDCRFSSCHRLFHDHSRHNHGPELNIYCNQQNGAS